VSSTPAVELSGNDYGQIVHTHVPLSPNSVIRYRPYSGDKFWLEEV